ncbi:efflux RND transporter periplasmic adaptor subunit [bacterium]|nr:efflux RND transporter periplasmic adaptor subunit [bacterium]
MIKKLHNKYINSKLGQQKGSTKFVYIIIIALIVWFALGMFFTAPKTTDEPTTKLVKVNVERLTAKNIVADILIYGHTEANEKVNLKIRTSGIVKTINKKKGQYVKKGDAIITLAMEDRMAKLRAAQAAKDKSELEFNTAKTLLQQDLISRVDFVANEAAYKNSRAALDQIILDIEYTILRAPFDGIINELNVEEGSYVNSGEDVGTFVNLNPIKIKAEIPEKYITRVRKGVVATALLSSKQKIEAMLVYVAAIANSSTRTFSIELEANNKDDRVAEGLTAEIQFPLDTISAIKLSVSSCLTFGENGEIGVKTVDDENIVHFYPIEIVKEESDGLWISGLPENANVIIAGAEFVKVGEKVDPTFTNDTNSNLLK